MGSTRGWYHQVTRERGGALGSTVTPSGEPDYSGIPVANYDWSRTVYGDVKEQLPHNAPRALGKRVIQTTYVDANLFHDYATGKAVTAVMHVVNQTIVGWFSKKQATVETATYGSEFAAARTAIQQITGLRLTLRYLGVEVHGPTILFGDNESVVKSGTIPHSLLNKRHHGLAYHYTREAVASDAVNFYHIPGAINPADILSKHWGYQQVWTMMQPILFWKGETLDLLKENLQGQRKGSEKSSIIDEGNSNLEEDEMGVDDEEKNDS